MRPHGDIIHLLFDRSRYMKNWWMGRNCRGCAFLHIGKSVSHNHCDHIHGDYYEEKRVNDHDVFGNCTLDSIYMEREN